MKLSIEERMGISDILSQKKDDYATMRIFRKAMEDMSLSEEEIKSSGYIQIPMPDGKVGMQWNNDPMKDFELSEIIVKFIQETMKRIVDAKNLRYNQISLYEKFVENYGK